MNNCQKSTKKSKNKSIHLEAMRDKLMKPQGGILISENAWSKSKNSEKQTQETPAFAKN